ncbi:hypothetical protein [Ralstonia pseudosolanacearum]|uniref:hypothetical protein n=1 Tax=Ralstonia pseudosolanacearum TaxID=1310165 RepID=UPI002005C269|nr:hypothetical protein [Ralstonia pseudosolanacearum]MCK4153488.1 hypothetical protein [Ralstonia pseudosolanacearum]
MPTQAQIDSFAHTAATAYREVYNAFDRQATDEGASLQPIRTECFVVNKPKGHSTVEVAGALRIERLSSRHRAAGKSAPAADRIAVVMSSHDIYAFDDAKPVAEASYLYEAFVDMGYYRVTTKGWQTLFAVRYDYGRRGATQGHPIFHAQMSDGSVGKKIAQLPATPPILPLRSEILNGVRMPTANMIGASALLKLSADHLSHGSFITVLQRVQGLAFFGNWRCNCSTLDDSNSVRGLLASGWYGCKP